MLKRALFILPLAGIASLLGCQTTTVGDAHRSLSQEITMRGTNPYIEVPALKDLEGRIQTVVLASNMSGEQYRTTFDPRNNAILGNFRDSFSRYEMMADIDLVRKGFEVAATERYAVTGTQTGCGITDHSGFFVNEKGEPNRFKWEFVKGACLDGVAHGLAEARSAQSQARFIGQFDHGVMLKGAFTMVQKDGDRVIQLGGVPAENRIARLLSTEVRTNGFIWYRYGDFDNQGKFEGFGVNIWNYTDLMLVKSIGQFQNNKLNGFGAYQDLRKVGEAQVWATWIGNYDKGQMKGFGAWTNGLTDLYVGEWNDGKREGVGYGQYASYSNSYHEFYVGRFVNGNKHGPFKVLAQNSYVDNEHIIENYDQGTFVSDSREKDDGGDFNFGQMFALATGAALIGSSGISDVSKVEIGGAFAADVLGGGNTSNLQSVQQNYQVQQQNTQIANGAQASGGLKTYQATIRCDSGTTSQIDVPYRTEQCRIAAVDFATTYSCNKLDQERVTRNCQSACGHPQCLEQ